MFSYVVCVCVCVCVAHISFPRSKLGSNQLVLSRQFAVRHLRVCLLCRFSFFFFFLEVSLQCVFSLYVCV